MIIELKRRHFRKSNGFWDPQRCPGANALREKIEKVHPSWKETSLDGVSLNGDYGFNFGITYVTLSYCEGDMIECSYYRYLISRCYTEKMYWKDKILSLFCGKNTVIRRLIISGLYLPELSDITSADLLLSSPEEQKV